MGLNAERGRDRDAESERLGRVRARAAEVLIALPEAKNNGALPRLLPFLLAPEPVVEELPRYFLPPRTEGAVDDGLLDEVAVAGKLLYAQTRWLDDLADSSRVCGSIGDAHSLSEALSREAKRRFVEALAPSGRVADFNGALSELYARYAASLALDANHRRRAVSALSLANYVEHAKARAAVPRAPLEALLAAVSARPEATRRARSCFDACAGALQLKDDALDVEEDYVEGRLSWVVAETLRALGSPEQGPSRDEFYEAALLNGSVERSLEGALALLEEARSSALGHLPGVVAYVEEESRDVRELRLDLKRIVDEFRRSP